MKKFKKDLRSYNEIMNSRIENAVYNEQVIDEFKGNPFIEALPTTTTIYNNMKNIDYTPIITEEERNQNIIGRASSIMKIKNLRCRLSSQSGLLIAIDSMIRNSYSYRNPLSPKTIKDIIKLAKASKDKKTIAIFENLFSETTVADNMITLLGGSGNGKTVTVSSILSMYPQIIKHDKYHCVPMDTMDQIVWLIILAPRDGSTKTLCINFFEEIDRVLGTNSTYTEMFANLTKSENEILNNIALQCRALGVGLVVIDEIQHLKANRDSTRLIINFFTEFANKIHVPVIFIGNDDANELFKVFRDIRRVGSGGEFTFLPLEKDKVDWKNVTERLWTLQVLRAPGELTKEINDVLFDESQGVIGVLIILFIFAQWHALINRKETLDSDIIREASGFYMQRIKNTLTNYKNGVRSALNDIGDIDEAFAVAENKLQFELSKYAAELEVMEKTNDKITKDNSELSEEIIGRVLGSGITLPRNYTRENLSNLVLSILSDNKKISKDMAYSMVINKLVTLPTNNKKTQKKEKYTGGLMAIDSSINFSDALEAAGKTPDYEEFGD